MIDFLLLLGCALTGLFRSRARLEAEILVLRQRINVLRRKSPKRPAFSNIDHLLLVWLSQLVPTTLEALTVVRPETVIRWHRAGFRAYWRFRSRPRGGRPKMPVDIRQLVRAMSVANPLWGAPRIHGELLKLGIEVGQTTVAKYMARGRRPPSQGWRTFLRNHADGIASVDLFVVPTISFRLLYGLLILRHGAVLAGTSRVVSADWQETPVGPNFVTSDAGPTTEAESLARLANPVENPGKPIFGFFVSNIEKSKRACG
jgi:hypothetical protein